MINYIVIKNVKVYIILGGNFGSNFGKYLNKILLKSCYELNFRVGKLRKLFIIYFVIYFRKR